MMYRTHLYSLAVIALLVAAVSAAGVCTGFPKMYDGKPCASTTRYWDGQMGACGCGTGNTNPFSWQWTKPTAAASAPVFGSGTWCGSGCGKCFRLTPTAAGAAPVGRGAPTTDSVVVKVTNLCPYSGNEEWCAYDVNTHGYDAHFDVMDYNMNGVISNMGWDNPEVTYEEVDCAANGYVDWGCQCEAAKSSPSSPSSPTTTPTESTKAPAVGSTKAAVAAPTKAPASPLSQGQSVKVSVASGVNVWWFGFTVVDNVAFEKIEIMDDASLKSWTQMTNQNQGGKDWNLWSISPKSGTLKAPLSLRFTTSSGEVLEAPNVISALTAGLIVDTKLKL